MTFRKSLITIIFPVLIVVLAGYYFLQNHQPKSLPVMGEIKAFELISSHKQKLSEKNLQGQVWVANFIFTSCQGVCPMMTNNMAKVRKVYQGRDDLSVVSISVDPEKDQPDVLKAYAKKYNADHANWHFLTGDREKIKKLMFEDFKLGFAEDVIFHSDRMVLLDRHNKIRGYYRGTDQGDFNRLSRDIALLLNEK